MLYVKKGGRGLDLRQENSCKYTMANNYIIEYGLKNVVGYSLGGFVADKLTNKQYKLT